MLVSGPVAQEKQGTWVISVIGATLKKLRDDAHDASLSHDGTKIVFRDAVKHGVWAHGCRRRQRQRVDEARGRHAYFLSHLAGQRQANRLRETLER